MSIEQVLYRAHATATGGRKGIAVTADGGLNGNMPTPKDLGGNAATGTNPEQPCTPGDSAAPRRARK